MKKIFKNQKGQAIFEFIIFMPFLVLLYTILYTVGNSINGSINQQKAVRGYFYTLVKSNSYLLNAVDIAELKNKAINKAGFFAIGWSEKKQGETRFAPCFKFSSMVKGTSPEDCDDSKRPDEGSSTYIRLFTAYGVCGAIFKKSQVADVFEYRPDIQSDALGCTLSNSSN